MANSLLTINMITREAVRLWRNSNSFIKHIDMQYDDSFAKGGAKIGTALRIRYPNDFTVRTGAAASVQDTSETSTTLVLATQKGVDVSYSSVDRTMSLDDFSRRVLGPMVNNLAGAVAVDVMSGAEGGISNFASLVDGTTGAIINPTAKTWLASGALLDKMSSSRDNRKIIMDPVTQANTVASLAGLFNPSAKISEQYRSGLMAADTLGFDWYSDQTVITHTTGSFNAGGAISSAGQTGTQIAVSAITGTFALGDIIYIDNVFAANRITKQSTGQLAQFVVTAPVISGATAINIYPAIIPPAIVNGVATQVQYQTVMSSPANAAQVHLVSKPNEVYRKNFSFAPDAVTMASADLELPSGGVIEAAREAFDGVSMRMISDYDIATDQFITRLDVLYGFLWVRPEWACVVADSLT